jgi:hypothetical protein
MNELEVRIWKEMANKLAWAIGSALGVPYAPGRSWARGVARELAGDVMSRWTESCRESTPEPGLGNSSTKKSAPSGPTALLAIEKCKPETWLPYV